MIRSTGEGGETRRGHLVTDILRHAFLTAVRILTGCTRGPRAGT
ncbi:hypothetical protein [Actinomadura sp. 9N407]